MKPEVNSENYQEYLKITDGIDQLLKNISGDTAMFSTHNHILKHEDFQKLVDMGDKIIPYLFHRLTHYGSSWIIFLLLRKITGQQPVPKEVVGRVPYVFMHWLKWFVESDYYKDNKGVYHGLI